MFEIRGMSLNTHTGIGILGVLLRDIKTGQYIYRNFEILPTVKPSTIINFLCENLKCDIGNIYIADHVSFERLGIIE